MNNEISAFFNVWSWSNELKLGQKVLYLPDNLLSMSLELVSDKYRTFWPNSTNAFDNPIISPPCLRFALQISNLLSKLLFCSQMCMPSKGLNQSSKAWNMPPQDVWKFPPVFYRTSALWGRCPALTPLFHWITPGRASGTADHVRSLDD